MPQPKVQIPTPWGLAVLVLVIGAAAVLGSRGLWASSGRSTARHDLDLDVAGADQSIVKEVAAQTFAAGTVQQTVSAVLAVVTRLFTADQLAAGDDGKANWVELGLGNCFSCRRDRSRECVS